MFRSPQKKFAEMDPENWIFFKNLVFGENNKITKLQCSRSISTSFSSGDQNICLMLCHTLKKKWSTAKKLHFWPNYYLAIASRACGLWHLKGTDKRFLKWYDNSNRSKNEAYTNFGQSNFLTMLQIYVCNVYCLISIKTLYITAIWWWH